MNAELERLSRENDDLRRNTAMSADQQKRIVEYENKIAVLSQEIERLNEVVLKKTS